MNTKITLLLCMVVTLVPPSISWSDGLEVDGVFGLRPTGAHSCIAVEVSATAANPLIGLSWFNNDATAAFPTLLLVEGLPGTPPNVNDPGLVLDSVSGESLAWGRVGFSGPVVSSTGTAYAVFFFPPFDERTGEGLGGGAGIGYRTTPSEGASFLSPDGFEWVRLRGDYTVSVNAVRGAMKGGRTRVLSEVGDVLALTRSGVSDPATPVAPLRTILRNPYPNPFNPRVTVSFDMAREGDVRIQVYDCRGRRVRTLAAGVLDAGTHALTWHGDDQHGKPVASGVYYVRMKVSEEAQERTVTLVR